MPRPVMCDACRVPVHSSRTPDNSMAQSKNEERGLIYQVIVTVAGLSVWLAAIVFVFTHHPAGEQLILLGFVPLVVVIGLFPNTFTPPSSLKRDKITFTLSDAFIFLIAC